MGQNQDMAQKFSELEAALERINAGQLAALYISIIDSQAEWADIRNDLINELFAGGSALLIEDQMPVGGTNFALLRSAPSPGVPLDCRFHKHG